MRPSAGWGRNAAEEHHHRHAAALEPRIERGQNAHVFRPDLPAAWHLATLLPLIPTAGAELCTGRVGEDEVEAALLASVVGVVAGPR